MKTNTHRTCTRTIVSKQSAFKALRVVSSVVLCLVLLFNASVGALDIGMRVSAAEITLDIPSEWSILTDGNYAATSYGHYNDINTGSWSTGDTTASVTSTGAGLMFAPDGDGNSAAASRFMYYVDLGLQAPGTYTFTTNSTGRVLDYSGAAPKNAYANQTTPFIFAGNTLNGSSALVTASSVGNNSTRTVSVTTTQSQHIYIGFTMNNEPYSVLAKSLEVTGSTTGEITGGGTGSGDSGDNTGGGTGDVVTPSYDVVTNAAGNVPAPSKHDSSGVNENKSYLGMYGENVTAANGGDFNFSFENTNDKTGDTFGWDFSGNTSIIQEPFSYSGINIENSYVNNYSKTNVYGPTGGESRLLRMQPGSNGSYATQIITGLNPDYYYRVGVSAMTLGKGNSVLTASAPGVAADQEGTYYISSNLGSFASYPSGNGNDNRANQVTGFHTCYVYAKPNADGELQITLSSDINGYNDYENQAIYGSPYTLWADIVTLASYEYPEGESITVPIKLYDYSFRHLDTARFFEFTWGSDEAQKGVRPGLVSGMLDENGRPVFTSAVEYYNSNSLDNNNAHVNPGSATNMSASHLNDTVGMFRKDAINSDITLYKITDADNYANDAYVGYYVFDSDMAYHASDCADGYLYTQNNNNQRGENGFFPMCGVAPDLDAEGIRHNYHFGMEFDAQFLVSASSDEIFRFTGDDDFWLFIDDVLILDIGGVHTAITGTVDLGNSTTTVFDTGDETNDASTEDIYAVASRNIENHYKSLYPNDSAKVTAETQKKLSEMFTQVNGKYKLSPGYHDLTIYYMERSTKDSNLKLITNLAFADLAYSKTAAKLNSDGTAIVEDDSVVELGDKIRYYISIENPSIVPSEKISISDTAPAGVSFINNSLKYYVVTNGVMNDNITQNLTMNPSSITGSVDVPAESSLVIYFDAEVVSTTDSSGKHINSITNFAYVNEGETISDTLYTNPLQVEKVVVNAKDNYSIGDTIIYKIVVTNLGTETLENVKVSDSLLGSGSWLSGNGTIATLAGGASAELTFQYTVQEGDLTNGKVTNTAVATAIVPGTDDEVSAEDSVEVPVVANNPALTVNKTVANVNNSAYATELVSEDPGNTIFFFINVENTGDAALTDIAVSDDHPVLFNGASYQANQTIVTIDSLAPGASEMVGPLSYVIPADADASAENVNTATASCTHNGREVESSDTAKYTIKAKPRLEATKKVSATGEAGTYGTTAVTVEKGQTVYYSFTIENKGNVPMTVKLEDVMDPAEINALDWVASALSSFVVEPGESRTIDNLAVTFPENVDYGADNTATNTLRTYATYVDPIDGQKKNYNPYPINSSVDVILSDPIVPDMSIDKAVTAINSTPVTSSIPVVVPGDVVTYTVTVTNEGNCPLIVSLEDMFDGTDISAQLSERTFTLAEGASRTVTVDVTIGNEDNASVLTNVATATGTVPETVAGDHEPIVKSDDASVVVKNENIVPAIDIKKSVDKTTAHAGDIVTYTLTVKNTGNVALTNVEVSDDKVFDANTIAESRTGWTQVGSTSTGTYTIGALPVGDDAVTIVYRYRVPDTALAGESYLNTAVVTADAPGGQLTDTDNETVTIGQSAEMLVTKTVSDNAPEQGDTIEFTVTVTNIGSTKLTNVHLVSDVFTVNGVAQTIPAAWQEELAKITVTLDPTESWTSAPMEFSVPSDAAQNTVYSNTVTVTSYETGNRSDNAVATVGNDIYSQVSISKVAVNSPVQPGQNADFVIVVTNNSNTTINDLVVYDIADVIGTTEYVAYPTGWTVGSLAPGAIWTKSVSIPTTDRMNGDILNTAYLDKSGTTFDPEQPDTFLDSDDAVVEVADAPRLQIEKTAGVTEVMQGSSVTYTVVVKNVGNCVLNDVKVTDSIPGGAWDISAATAEGFTVSLESGSPVISVMNVGDDASFTYTLSNVTGNAGEIVHNVAHASCDTPATGTVEDDADVTIIARPDAPAPSMAVEKNVSSDTARAGETVSFWFTVTNTGNVPLYDVAINDVFTRQLGSSSSVVDSTGWQINAPTTLAVGETWNSGLLRYAIPAGTTGGTLFDNVVTVNANETQGDPDSALDPVSDDAEVRVPMEPALTVSKVANRTTVSEGQTIVYTIVVENTGNCDLKNVELTEILTGGRWSVPGTNDHNISNLNTVPRIPALTVGDKATLLYTYVVPAETPEGTEIENTVTANSKYVKEDGTDGTVPPVSDDETVLVTEPENPEITVTKTVTSASAKPGETEYFQITVTNTGNVPLRDIVLTDVFNKVNAQGTARLSTAGWDLDCPVVLPVGGMWVSDPMPYTVAADAPAGEKYDNTVTVTSRYQKEDGTLADVAPKQANAFFTVEEVPAMTITKTANVAQAKAGDTVVYTIVVENTGNCALRNVDVTDSIAGGTWVNTTTDTGVSVSMNGAHPILTVFPADSVASFTYTCRVPANAVAGSTIENIANAEVTLDPATGEKLSVSDDVDVIVAETPIVPAPAFTVTKDVSTGTAKPGETVFFWITVTNTGNVPLYSISLEDEFVRQLGDVVNTIPTSAWTLDCPAELGVGETWTTSAPLSYQVPANANGSEEFINTVTVNASHKVNGSLTPVGEQSDDASFTVERTDDMKITKTVTPATQVAGGDVYYTITVENTGNTVLKDIVVTDEMLDGEWEIDSLAPGKTYIIPTVTYTIPANHDIEAEPQIVNTAVATGTPEGSTTPIVRQDTATVTPTEKPPVGEITITKEVIGSTERQPGDVVAYTILVENNSSIDYTDLTVTDQLLGKTWTIASLKAGQTHIIPVSESVLVLDSHAPAGDVVNVAKLLDKDGNTLDEDDALITVLEAPEVTVIKSANVSTAKPGDTVVYTITVTNTGNVDLTNVVVEDTITGGTWTLPSTLPAGCGEVKINENGTVSVAKLEVEGAALDLTYTCTIPADAKNGDTITNIAIVDTAQTEPVQSEAPVTVDIPSLEVVKTAASPNVTAGQDADFYITVTNTGKTALTKVSVSDIFAVTYEGEEYDANEVFAVIETLEPNESQRFKVTYAVPEDAKVGDKLVNTATAEAENGASDQDSDTVEVYEPVVESPSFVVRKLSNVAAAKPGDTVTYTIVVANTGNVTLTNVAVTDSLNVTYNGTPVAAGSVITTIPAIEPEKSEAVEVTYTVPEGSQAGTYLTNRATADPENADPATAENLVQILAKDNPSYTVTKVGNVTSAKPGDTVTYTIVVTNTGNCTLNNLEVYDDLIDKTFVIGSLKVGEVWKSQSGEAAYQIPSSAQDATSVSNHAVGSTDTPNAGSGRGEWVLSVTATNKGPIGPDTGDHSADPTAAIIIAVVSAACAAMVLVVLRRQKSLMS